MNQGEVIEPREIFLNAVLYKKLPRENANELENFHGTLDMYCLECKQDSVFKRLETPRGTPLPVSQSGGTYGRADKRSPRIFSIEFGCSRDEDHKAVFVFRIDEKSISKIVQNWRIPIKN
jgi:hypothetical protein